MTNKQMQADALNRATTTLSMANYGTILAEFSARGIAKAPDLLELVRDWIIGVKWRKAAMRGLPPHLLSRAETLLEEIEGRQGGSPC